MKKLLMACLALVFAASVHAAEWWQVYESTGANATVTIDNGASYLWKVIVSSAGTSSSLEIANSKDSFDNSNRVFTVNTTAVGDYELNVSISSGITIRSVETNPASWQLMYRSGHQGSKPQYQAFTECDAESSAVEVFQGAGILHRVIIASGTATNNLIDIYNSHDEGTGANTAVAHINGVSNKNLEYNVAVSSGLSYTTAGSGCWGVIYKRGL